MKIYITNERMNGVLPENIKETKELTPAAKKVLAYLLNNFYSFSMVDENGYFYRTNNEMRKDLGIGMGNMLEAIQELIDTNLIMRKVGETLPTGERLASRYYIQWDNLEKPVVKPTASDMIRKYLSKKKDNTNAKQTVNVHVNVEVPVTVNQHVEHTNDNEDYDDEDYSNWTDDKLKRGIERKKVDIQQKSDTLKNTTTEKDKYSEEYWLDKYVGQVKAIDKEIKRRNT